MATRQLPAVCVYPGDVIVWGEDLTELTVTGVRFADPRPGRITLELLDHKPIHIGGSAKIGVVIQLKGTGS